MKPTKEQVDELIAFMGKHRDLARGQSDGPEARARTSQLWKQITVVLNSMGGCSKEWRIWQKYWIDKRTWLKKSAGRRYRAASHPGVEVPQWDEQDEQMLLLLVGDGCHEGNPVAVNPFPKREQLLPVTVPTVSRAAPVAPARPGWPLLVLDAAVPLRDSISKIPQERTPDYYQCDRSESTHTDEREPHSQARTKLSEEVYDSQIKTEMSEEIHDSQMKTEVSQEAYDSQIKIELSEEVSQENSQKKTKLSGDFYDSRIKTQLSKEVFDKCLPWIESMASSLKRLANNSDIIADNVAALAENSQKHSKMLAEILMDKN